MTTKIVKICKMEDEKPKDTKTTKYVWCDCWLIAFCTNPPIKIQ